MKSLKILAPACAAMLIAVLGARLAAQQEKHSPAPAPSAASGAEMYRSYCASCHGLDGKGKGPAAPALKRAPADLTSLARRNQGKFPEVRVFQTIEGEASLAAHGSRDMPVWGVVFRTQGGSDEATVKLRLRNLTRYLESIQGK